MRIIEQVSIDRLKVETHYKEGEKNHTQIIIDTYDNYDYTDANLELYRIKEILTPKEKEYLGNAIRPFKDQVNYITKRSISNNEEYIYINIKDGLMSLPRFPKNSMYAGMLVSKEYSPKELEL